MKNCIKNIEVAFFAVEWGSCLLDPLKHGSHFKNMPNWSIIHPRALQLENKSYATVPSVDQSLNFQHRSHTSAKMVLVDSMTLVEHIHSW